MKLNALTFIGSLIAGLVLVLAVLILIPPKVRVVGIPSGFTEKQFDTGEVILNYIEGPDNGVPLLLIPGQMESWQGYKPVMSELAQRYHVFSVDLRGHGKSSRTPGQYSYNICGNDLKLFLEHVIEEPAIVSGLSSGAVLTVWLAAYAPDEVRAIIAEDPPMFASIWPRIREEKYMTRMFQHAVDTLGGAGGRDLEAYYAGLLCIPQEGKEELVCAPAPIGKAIVKLYGINKRLRPGRTDDPPFLPFYIRSSFKFLSEYDVDFSRATIDGRLSEGFDPDDALGKVSCPMLLLHASWSRHETWGLLGAMDDTDVQRIRTLVPDVHYAHAESGHAIHMEEPKWYLEQVNAFLDGLN